MEHRIGVLGLGAYLPTRIMTNEDWKEYVDTSDEWITARTGIKRRRIAAPGETTVTLALGAARCALERAGLGAQEIDEIIVATDTPEVRVPDTAAFVQHQLGARNVAAYDLAGSGCAGFIQALNIAHARVHLCGGKVLTIGVEVLSRIISWRDRNTSVLFGDAAGAAIVGAGPGAAKILASVSGTDGSRADMLGLGIGGTRNPFTLEAAAQGLHQRVLMNGREVFKEAVRRMSGAARDVLAKAGMALGDVALVVPHQANLRIIEAVAEALKLPLERFFINIHEYGNTGSASIPLALWEAQNQGFIRPGDRVLLTSFGAGFHWASMLLEF